MDNEQAHQELVKCVVVGDTAVGKTRLICARACESRLDLSHLMQTHIPTVWAIDQYRIHKEVLERSCEVLDGVNVSLRLWDTFGDHDKDRRFAYGRSDVVLLCFSIANPNSLRNCRQVWYPEIRKFCPNTPIVLVGCKNDLRFMYRDEKFLNMCRERSPFFRPLRECDLLTPEQGRAVARDISAPYFETSVFTSYGVSDAFENILRVALNWRRQQRFWMTNLKHVQRPLLQEPFCPPRPQEPAIIVPESEFEEHLRNLFYNRSSSDCILKIGAQELPCHRVILLAASAAFSKLFSLELLANIEAGHTQSSANTSPPASLVRSSSDSSIASSAENSNSSQAMDTQSLLGGGHGHEEAGRTGTHVSRINSLRRAYQKTAALFSSVTTPITGSSCINGKNVDAEDHAKHPRNLIRRSSASWQHLTEAAAQIKLPIHRDLQKHPLFEAIEIAFAGDGKLMTTVFIKKIVSFAALEACVKFMYTGLLDGANKGTMAFSDVTDIAEALELKRTLLPMLQNLDDDEINFSNKKRIDLHASIFREQLGLACLQDRLYCDVTFQLDDGRCRVHRSLLIARSAMMEAMFRGDYRESSAKVIMFPGVAKQTFEQLIHYIYTDTVRSDVVASTCLKLLELANRLCLSRLVALVEQRIALDLQKLSEEADVVAVALPLLEPCQIHNATQLADWCLFTMSVRYDDAMNRHLKQFRCLHPENQAHLNRNRWPPVWFTREFEFYERCVRERLWKEKPKGLKRHRLNSGCLCFSTKKRGQKEKHH